MAYKVLLVDDDEDLLDGLMNVLRKEPYQFRCASSADQALLMLDEEFFDVVISDERMPGMSGTQFLSNVLRDHPQTIRMILTGHATAKTAAKAISEGRLFRYLLKPCQPKDLAAAIHEGLMLREIFSDDRRLMMSASEQNALAEKLEKKAETSASILASLGAAGLQPKSGASLTAKEQDILNRLLSALKAAEHNDNLPAVLIEVHSSLGKAESSGAVTPSFANQIRAELAKVEAVKAKAS
jgi:two-component system probable response regulator PhcQ